MATDPAGKPRVGIPYRTRKEELASDRSRYDMYIGAVRQAGGEPVEVSLGWPASRLAELARALDAFLLPGSPADLDPALYSAPRHLKCADPDPDRQRTDFALLERAFCDRKPLLAICYGIQSLNVFLGGSLIQDISSELHLTTIQHEWAGRKQGTPEPFHAVQVDSNSRLFKLARTAQLRVNSSHHQSVLKPGRALRCTAVALDGVVEAVEWIGDSNWVLGVQWHPERLVETERGARALFEGLVQAAGRAIVENASSHQSAV
jgi:putative glutamine amidotransferase